MFDLVYNIVNNDILGITAQNMIDFPILEDVVFLVTIIVIILVMGLMFKIIIGLMNVVARTLL